MFSFSAFHQLLAQLHGTGGGHIGILCQQVRHQRVAEPPINAGNDEQRPQRDFQVDQKIHFDNIQIAGAKHTPQRGERRFAIGGFPKYF